MYEVRCTCSKCNTIEVICVTLPAAKKSKVQLEFDVNAKVTKQNISSGADEEQSDSNNGTGGCAGSVRQNEGANSRSPESDIRIPATDIQQATGPSKRKRGRPSTKKV